MELLLTSSQSNHYLRILKSIGGWVLKLGITIACFYFIWIEVTTQPILIETSVYTKFFSLSFLIVVILMPINWLLEAERWRVSITEVPLTLIQSLKIVLSGLALNWVIPLTLGDAIRRLGSKDGKVKKGYALVINRSIMLFLTTFYGTLSVLYYFKILNWVNAGWLLLSVFLLGTVIIWMNRLRYVRKIALVLPIGSILFYSILRYVVFTLQFYLLIHLFIPELSIPVLLLGIGWIYFFRSYLPSLFGSFGIREASALMFFSAVDPHLVLIPCVLIWLINTVVPSIIGSMTFFNFPLKLAQ